MEDIEPTQAENIESVAPLETDAPAVEQQATDQDESQAEAPDQGQELTEEGHKPSRAERRIRNQASRIRELEAERPGPNPEMQLQMQMRQLQQSYEQGEITAQELLANQDTVAQLRADQRVQQSENRMQYRLDLMEVEAAHPELNPKSNDYDEDYADKVATLYQRMGGINSGVRLTEVVDEVNSLANRRSAKAQMKTQASLVKQAAEGALTPTVEPEAPTNGGDQLLATAKHEGTTEAWAEYFASQRSK